MVNPILATIIKKAIKGGMASQYGGDGSEKSASEGNETSVGVFLLAVIILIIGEFIGADYIAKSMVETEFKNLSCDNNEVSEEPTSAASVATSASVDKAAPVATSASVDKAAPVATSASVDKAAPVAFCFQ